MLVKEATGVESGIFQQNYVNIMAVHALSHCSIMSSAAIVLTALKRQVFVFHRDLFQLPAPSQNREMIENATCYLENTMAAQWLIMIPKPAWQQSYYLSGFLNG